MEVNVKSSDFWSTSVGPFMFFLNQCKEKPPYSNGVKKKNIQKNNEKELNKLYANSDIRKL